MSCHWIPREKVPRQRKVYVPTFSFHHNRDDVDEGVVYPHYFLRTIGTLGRLSLHRFCAPFHHLD